MGNIAVVVPTVRPERIKIFKADWAVLFNTHGVEFIEVRDGKIPLANGKTAKEIMGKNSDLVYNFNDGVRNLGFAYVAKYLPQVSTIITLDDDTEPRGDTIKDHLRVLSKAAPVTWMMTTSRFTRGFPYGIREEAEIVLSHGLWWGVKDWDAPTQLVNGNPDVLFYDGPIPRGVFYPMCGMNIAFKRKLLPYMYFAPMGPRVGLDRFADIWCGIESKKVIDERGWAVYSGGAYVNHLRASNVWENLQKESAGLEMNENYGQGEYFKLYAKQRERWRVWMQELL